VDRIEDFQAFVAIVDKGSLTAAAKQLGRSLQSISRSLATLEGDLGVELIARTTRRSAATEAGLAFYRRVGAALSEIEAAKLETSNRRSEPVGLLRITCSTVFAPLYVVPAVCAFLESHPKVDIDLDMSDGYVDLISQGFDLAIRIGELPDSSLKARRLADLRRVVFAAPDYFAKHGRPKVPGDLAGHQCLVRTSARDSDAWPFLVRSSGALAVNEAAVQGLGIANAPLWQVRALVDRGGGRAGLDQVRAAAGARARRMASNQIVAGQDPIIPRLSCRPPQGRAPLSPQAMRLHAIIGSRDRNGVASTARLTSARGPIGGSLPSCIAKALR
jgi:DNA-binding transcriptional LysR family regulator